MISARCLDDEVCPSCGGRKECVAFDGTGGAGKTPLQEIAANYQGCVCATCGESALDGEESMTAPAGNTVYQDPHQEADERVRTYLRVNGIPDADYGRVYRVILDSDPYLKARVTGRAVPLPDEVPAGRPSLGPGPVVVEFADGSRVETDGSAIDQAANGDRLHAFALAHQEREKRERHRNCPYPEAFEVACRLNREWARGYARVGPSVEDDLRRIPRGQDVIVEHGIATYHVHGGAGYAARDEKPATPEAARRKLKDLVAARQKESPADAWLAVIGTEEGKALLEIILGE